MNNDAFCVYSNVIAYNLGSACLLCGNQSLENWKSWAQNYECAQTFIPSNLAYTASSGSNIPTWAYRMLDSTDASFDVNIAIQSDSSSKSAVHRDADFLL